MPKNPWTTDGFKHCWRMCPILPSFGFLCGPCLAAKKTHGLFLAAGGKSLHLDAADFGRNQGRVKLRTEAIYDEVATGRHDHADCDHIPADGKRRQQWVKGIKINGDSLPAVIGPHVSEHDPVAAPPNVLDGENLPCDVAPPIACVELVPPSFSGGVHQKPDMYCPAWNCEFSRLGWSNGFVRRKRLFDGRGGHNCYCRPFSDVSPATRPGYTDNDPDKQNKQSSGTDQDELHPSSETFVITCHTAASRKLRWYGPGIGSSPDRQRLNCCPLRDRGRGDK
jgi:hypothetical protein